MQFGYGILVVSTASIVVNRPSFAHSWIKQLLFALYIATTLTLALYDGNMFDVTIRKQTAIESHMCIVTMNTYSSLVGLPLSIIMSVLWLLVVSTVGEEGAIQLDPEEV